MAAQFGRWNFDGVPIPSSPPDSGELPVHHGKQGPSRYCDHEAELLWFPFDTTEEHPGQQPMLLDSGEVLLWDGRLDNGPEILRALGLSESAPPSDVAIVTAAWSRWGADCFARLIGDWALSLWNPRDRCLLLAADLLATRHLCYVVERESVKWSSVPDPLILLPGRDPVPDEEYLAGWLGSFPAAHLTPFKEIRRVPPASVVIIRPGSVVVRRYWDFDGTRRIRYARDAEYESHFLELFRQSVRRRLRSDWPILAELSGGMDSSAIVCVADQLTDASGGSKIDTVSWYNDSEPHWNERPWFTRVESHRGKSGLHVDVNTLSPELENEGAQFPVRPGAGTTEGPILEFMIGHGHRVLLSGIGGDEFLGGVPTPVPELEDLLARGRFIALWRQLLAWALVGRRPWPHLLGEALIGFLPPRLRPARTPQPFAPWINPEFMKRHCRPLGRYAARWRLRGPLPSFQEASDALEVIRRYLGCRDLAEGHPFERRYPFLDRDLLEFLFAVPREQLVRPGERRSLMRRALRGIVPDEILWRKRKAWVIRSPMVTAERHYRTLSARGAELLIGDIGIVDSGAFLNALHAAGQGRDNGAPFLLRAVAVEQWLEALRRKDLLGRHAVGTSGEAKMSRDHEPEILSAAR